MIDPGKHAFGQYGSAFLSGTGTYTPPSGKVVIAIQFITAAKFDSSDATTADCDFPPDAQGGAGTNSVAINQTEFPAGVTIYGRWKTVALDSGTAMLYLGK